MCRVISKLSGRKTLAGRIVIGLVVVASVGASSAASATSGDQRAASAPSRAVRWPAPSPNRVLKLVKAAGLVPETHESFEHHVHAHLDVYLAGKHLVVPAGIGINTTDPAVKHFTVDGQAAYGRINECSKPCISPLHTHDVTGIIHTESVTSVENTLGQFFTEWGIRLSARCVDKYCTPHTRIAMYVDGRRQRFADAARIALSDHKEIALVIGRPPSQIPVTADFPQA